MAAAAKPARWCVPCRCSVALRVAPSGVVLRLAARSGDNSHPARTSLHAHAPPHARHELNGHPDFGALYPEGIPLPPLPPPAPPPRFYELEPQRDSRPPHRGPPLPHQRFVPRPPGAEPLPEPEEAEDEEGEEEEEEEEEDEEEEEQE